MAGSIFATLSCWLRIKFRPTQKIKMEPIRDIYWTASAVIRGEMRFASKVMEPSKKKTGMAEKAQPFPMEEVMTAMIMKSRTDLTARIL